MILSEYGAIKSAISEGGFILYPAGKLLNIIKDELSGDELLDNFDPNRTVEKISRIVGPSDPAAKPLFTSDMGLLCKRLSVMKAEYDIDAVFDGASSHVSTMAKRYYGIDKIEIPRPQVVEYFFEGHNDVYKNAKWSAFNVDRSESRDLGVPVGVYFKRTSVSPGYTEYCFLHEANHAMQEIAFQPDGYHYYVPWLFEGLADVLARLMLFRMTGDDVLMTRLKNYRTEDDLGNPRRTTYYFGEQICLMMLLRGRLPFMKAFMRAVKREPFVIDWDSFGKMVLAGWDPHIAIASAHVGSKVDVFRKRLEKDEALFRKEADFDQADLRILSMFLTTQAPACIPPDEFVASRWIMNELMKRPSPHYVDPQIIPEKMRADIDGWSADVPLPVSAVPESAWEKYPEIGIKILISEKDIPVEIKQKVDALADNYFIIKRKIGESIVYEPYGGGLPYRLGVGEVRCTY